MAGRWRDSLAAARARLGLEVRLFAFRNTGGNNADLPAEAWAVPVGEGAPDGAEGLSPGAAVPMERVLSEHSILFALTELSATAPLKVAARRFGFRAATTAGFSAAMLPALRLDLDEVDRRVRRMAGLLDRAEGADLVFEAAGAEHRLHLDLRLNPAHASSGILREPGQVGNVPSGEAYVVPYEGERPGEPSRSAGVLPVELDGEVVLYRVEGNRAVAVVSEGAASAREAERLRREPAYGNLAELGLGVLAGMGIEPIGSVLLDEKLGLHIAFGRSDHFGGAVGPGDFSAPGEVVHIDRIYLPAVQPNVRVVAVDLVGAGGAVALIRDGEYAVSFE